ncbi:MAG: tetratricopeptide repeat protein [Promethearchaeota archaeon]
MTEQNQRDNLARGSTVTSVNKLYKPTTSDKARDAYNRGVECTSKSDYKSAVKYYKKAIKIDAGYVDAYDNLGLVYRKLGILDEAEDCYKKSIQLYPDGIVARVNLGVVYRKRKDYMNAIKQYAEIKRIDQDEPEGYFGSASVNIALKNYDEALIDAKKALILYKKKNSPLLREGFFLLGNIYYIAGDLENARKYIKKAQDAGFKTVPYYILTGVGMFTSKDITNKEIFDAFWNEFTQLIDAKWYKQALPLSKIIIPLKHKDPNHLFIHGMCLFETGEYAEATSYFLKAYDLDLKFEKALYRACLSIATLNDESELLKLLNKVFAYDSSLAIRVLRKEDVSKLINDNNMVIIQTQYKKYFK